MAASSLPHSSANPNQLLPEQYIFEIFLNTSALRVIYNNTDLILPLDPLRLYKDYFNPLLHGTPFQKISLFLLLCGIPRLKSLQKVHFWFLL